MAIDVLVRREPQIVLRVDRRRRHARSRRWILAGVTLSMAALSLAYLAGNEAQANTQFDQTRHTLTVTTGRLARASDELIAVRRSLHLADGQVTADSAELAGDTSQLQAVQQALDGAQADVTSQTSMIGDLQVCLSGVEQALNALAVAAQGRAIQALDAVATSCSSAVASGG